MSSPIGEGGVNQQGAPNPATGYPGAANYPGIGQSIANNLNPAGVANAVGGAVGSLVTGALGIKANTFNIILNTLFYGTLSGVGVWLMYKGLTILASDVPGAAGVQDVLGAPLRGVKRVGSGAVGVGKFAATDGLSAGVSVAKFSGRVGRRAGQKVAGATHDFVHGAPRHAAGKTPNPARVPTGRHSRP
jgi:hypothetical protein